MARREFQEKLVVGFLWILSLLFTFLTLDWIGMWINNCPKIKAFNSETFLNSEISSRLGILADFDRMTSVSSSLTAKEQIGRLRCSLFLSGYETVNLSFCALLLELSFAPHATPPTNELSKPDRIDTRS